MPILVPTGPHVQILPGGAGGVVTALISGPIKAVVGFKPIQAKLGFKAIKAVLAEGGCGPMGTDLEIPKGTIATIPFDLEDGDGNALDATTATAFRFAVKRRIKDTDENLFTELTLGSGVSAPGTPTTARINVALTATQTEHEEDDYFYELWVTIGGETQRSANGKYRILPRVRT